MLTKEDLLRTDMQGEVDNTAAKHRESALIAAQVEEFLTNGGKIKQLQPDDYKQNPSGQSNNHTLFVKKEPLSTAPKRPVKNNFVINNKTNKLSTGELKRFTGKNKQVKA